MAAISDKQGINNQASDLHYNHHRQPKTSSLAQSMPGPFLFTVTYQYMKPNKKLSNLYLHLPWLFIL